MRPAKNQVSLGIHLVWSESSLPARRNLGSLATHWAHSEDWSDWVDAHAGCTCHFVVLRLIWVLLYLNHFSHVTRKPVFGVCDQLRLKPACSADETSWGLEIPAVTSRGILSRQRTTRVLISLRGCAGWSAPLLFISHKQVFSWCGSYVTNIINECYKCKAIMAKYKSISEKLCLV